MKQCKACHKIKPLSDFPKDNSRPRKYRANCKECANKKYREYCKKTDYHRKRYQDIKEAERWRHVAKKYGISPEEYTEIFERQGGKCATCGTTDSGKKPFCVDHDHSNGHVRGLLCTPCNQMIGHAKDDPKRLRQAARYLEASSRKSPIRSSGR